MKSAHTQLKLEITDTVAYLTLDGPPRNEMDTRFFAALSELKHTLSGRGLDVSGMVVQGAGRHFSSGARIPEIEHMASGDTDLKRLLSENITSLLALTRQPFPVVALIRGCCLGAGMELALACHYRIAERNAVFSLPEVTYGLMPGCGGTIRLPKLIGKAKAIEMILSGRTVLADEALEIGLVDRVVPKNMGEVAAIQHIHQHALELGARDTSR